MKRAIPFILFIIIAPVCFDFVYHGIGQFKTIYIDTHVHALYWGWTVPHVLSHRRIHPISLEMPISSPRINLRNG